MFTQLPGLTSLFDKTNPSKTTQNHAKDFSTGQSTSLKGNSGFPGRGQLSDNFAIFNDILQKSYQKMAFSSSVELPENAPSFQPQSEIAGYARVDKISSQQAADTILSFISQRIKSDQGNGANSDELLQRLEQGLEGFVKGFNEAKDIIEDMGLLTPALSGEINTTYDLVTKGVEALRNEINGIATERANTVIVEANLSSSESFSLAVTTQDGDRVSIEISRAEQASFSSLNASQQYSSSNSFNLSVEGELDEGEMAALNQLLQDVDQIAGDFFKGNYAQAFEQAIELNINKDELNSLDLQLKKTTTIQALAAYGSTVQNDSENTKQVASPITELNNLLDNIKNILEEAKTFAAPLRLITDVADGVERLNNLNQEQRQTSELSEMLSSLINKFNL